MMSGRVANPGDRRPRRARRGMTFIEVVCASAIVGIVAAAVFSAFSFVSLTQVRETRNLACMEVANRLMLSYLDNPSGLGEGQRVVEYGPPEAAAKFRYDLSEQPVKLVEVAADRRSDSRSPLKLDRFKVITVRVWLSEESGGARSPGNNVPEATLTRMIDPVALRNPDSIANMMKDPRQYERFMQSIMGFSQPAAAAVAGTGNSSGAGLGPAGSTGNGGRAGMYTPRSRSARPGRGGARDAFGRQRSNSLRSRPRSWGLEQWGGPGDGMVDPY
jgi:prepilin-type N-terminal cleavage/methylation domain-containing protein